eukprot:TRINITY_DN22187_c0_g2_i1.p1 TRINITY_DN22187_c0_g2~~TRINITY_DN22187_c0_g2_i1.p1  ORF type:complete len:845 (-),score=203.92 TRINITY_DN22187_c0_g2_i1:83-2617(-)
MSLDWSDRDLSEWAQRTLPEFLLVSMQDPDDRKRILARTPWEGYEVSVAEVQIEGEVNLIGRKNQPMLQFELDLGMRIDVEKKLGLDDNGEQIKKDVMDYWPAIAQIVRFESTNLRPQIITRLQEVPQEVAPEVNWFLQEGMGKRYIWHGLARWHAYATKKWLKVDAAPIEDPYSNPVPAPSFPPFLEESRRRYEDEVRKVLLSRDEGDSTQLEFDEEPAPSLAGGLSALADGFSSLAGGFSSLPHSIAAQSAVARRRLGIPEEQAAPAYVSPPNSDEEDDFDPFAPFEFNGDSFERQRKGQVKMKKFGRYPYLPSMLCGLGGPAKDWLRPKEYAIGHPEWFEPSSSSTALQDAKTGHGVTHLDMIIEKARKRKEEFEKLSSGKLISMRAAELCEAIEKGDVMKAFAKLDEETASCPHPDTGRSALHCCIAKGSLDLLEMVIEAKADVDTKDSFGQTPLMMAAKKGDQAVVKALLDAGADAAATDSLGRSAGDMVKVIEPAEDEASNPLKNWREKMAGDPIPEDEAKKTSELKALIDSKEKPKKYGASLLGALSQKDARTAEAAIEAGGDVNSVDQKGDSALLLIAKTRWKDQEGVQLRLAQKVFKAGANLDFQNVQGNTALHFAAHRGNLELLETLLRLRADPSLANSEGSTALMYAAYGGHEEACTALLEACAPVGPKNRSGLTAESMAQQKGFKICAALIHAYEMAPKQVGDTSKPEPKKKEKKKEQSLAFDYSRWDALEREMREDEERELNTRQHEAGAALQRPSPKFEDLGPEAFGLPADTPWPPQDASQRKKGPFDYSHWDKVVDDIERQEKVVERYEHLQANPRYEERNGQKMQVIF